MNDRIVAAVKHLRGEVLADYDEWLEATPKNRRLAVIAKAICAQKGRDPDVIGMGRPGQVTVICGNGIAALDAHLMPAWASYLDEAYAALSAVEAA